MRTKILNIYLIIVFLLLCSFALHFHSFWLPFIPQQLTIIKSLVNFIENKSAFLQGLGVIISGLLFILRNIRNKLTISSIEDKNDFLHPITIQELRDNLGRGGGKVEWIDRNIIDVEDLRRDRRIALMGTMKIGKTREAIELIAKAIESDLILSSSIFIPDITVSNESLIKMQSKLKDMFYGKSSAIILFDDFPQYFNGQMLDDLKYLINITEDLCPNLFLIFTVRSDQWKESHRKWLNENDINLYRVGHFNREQIKNLIENALKTFHMKADLEVKELFINNSDGTPEQPLNALRQLHVSGRETITIELANMHVSKAAKMIWYDSRHLIAKKNPLGREIIQVLSEFHSCGLIPYINIVKALVALRWCKNHGWYKIIRITKELHSALNYLMNYDIVAGNRFIIAPEDALIKMSILQTQLNLGKWLLDQDTFFRKILLKYFFNALEDYYKILISIEKIGQDHPYYDDDIHRRLSKRKDAFVKKVVTEMDKILQESIDEFFHSKDHIGKEINLGDRNLKQYFIKPLESAEDWCNQGFEYLKRNNRAEAWKAFLTSINISSDFYSAYFGKSLLAWEWGQQQEAIAECKKAIQLNPKFQRGYYLLGHMYSGCFELDNAEKFYKKSLDLNPEFIPSIVGLAKVSLLRDQPQIALELLEAKYQKEITNKTLGILIGWLKIMMSDSSIEKKGELAFALLISYLPEVTATIINSPIHDLEIALKQSKVIISHLINEHTEDVNDIELIDMLLTIADLNVLEGRLKEAICILKKAAEYNPSLMSVYILLGDIYILSNFPADALETYKHANNLFPKAIDAQIGLVRAYIFSEKIDEAISILYNTLDLDPYAIETHIMLAVCYQRYGYEDKLIEQLNFIKNSDNLDIYNEARLEVLKGNDNDALKLLDAAFNKNLGYITTIKADPCFTSLINEPTLYSLIEKYKYNIVTKGKDCNN